MNCRIIANYCLNLQNISCRTPIWQIGKVLIFMQHIVYI